MVTTRTNEGDYRTTRSWPLWQKRARWPTSSYVRAMPTVSTMSCNSSNPPCTIWAAKRSDCYVRIAAFTIKRVFKLLEDRHISYIISARLTYNKAYNRPSFGIHAGLRWKPDWNWWRLPIRPTDGTARRIVEVRPSVKRKNAPGKTIRVYGRSRHSRLVLWCDGNQSELADYRNMAQLPETCKLQE